MEWWKGDKQILPGPRYKMRLDGKNAELEISNVFPEDAGMYSCVTGDQKTKAEVKIKGQTNSSLNHCDYQMICVNDGVKRDLSMVSQLVRLPSNESFRTRCLQRGRVQHLPASFLNLVLRSNGGKVE